MEYCKYGLFAVAAANQPQDAVVVDGEDMDSEGCLSVCSG